MTSPDCGQRYRYLSTDFNFTTPITVKATCDADAKLVYYSSPHQAAGGLQTENVLKCQLKPLLVADSTGVTFTAAQQTRLNAGFAGGVCDWSKPASTAI